MQILSRPRFNVNYRSSGTSLKGKKICQKMKVSGERDGSFLNNLSTDSTFKKNENFFQFAIDSKIN